MTCWTLYCLFYGESIVFMEDWGSEFKAEVKLWALGSLVNFWTGGPQVRSQNI